MRTIVTVYNTGISSQCFSCYLYFVLVLLFRSSWFQLPEAWSTFIAIHCIVIIFSLVCYSTPPWELPSPLLPHTSKPIVLYFSSFVLLDVRSTPCSTSAFRALTCIAPFLTGSQSGLLLHVLEGHVATKLIFVPYFVFFSCSTTICCKFTACWSP